MLVSWSFTHMGASRPNPFLLNCNNKHKIYYRKSRSKSKEKAISSKCWKTIQICQQQKHVKKIYCQNSWTIEQCYILRFYYYLWMLGKFTRLKRYNYFVTSEMYVYFSHNFKIPLHPTLNGARGRILVKMDFFCSHKFILCTNRALHRYTVIL